MRTTLNILDLRPAPVERFEEDMRPTYLPLFFPSVYPSYEAIYVHSSSQSIGTSWWL